MLGKFRLLSQGKTSSYGMVLSSQFFLPVCSVLCFCNPPELWHGLQDLERAYVIILMRAYMHGGWAYRQRVSTTFWLWKTRNIFIVLRMGFEPLVFGSWVDALPIGSPCHPRCSWALVWKFLFDDTVCNWPNKETVSILFLSSLIFLGVGIVVPQGSEPPRWPCG